MDIQQAKDLDQRLQGFRKLLDDVHEGVQARIQLDEDLKTLPQRTARLKAETADLQKNKDLLANEYNKAKAVHDSKLSQLAIDFEQRQEVYEHKIQPLKDQVVKLEAKTVELENHHKKRLQETEEVYHKRLTELQSLVVKADERLSGINKQIEDMKKRALQF